MRFLTLPATRYLQFPVDDASGRSVQKSAAVFHSNPLCHARYQDSDESDDYAGSNNASWLPSPQQPSARFILRAESVRQEDESSSEDEAESGPPAVRTSLPDPRAPAASPIARPSYMLSPTQVSFQRFLYFFPRLTFLCNPLQPLYLMQVPAATRNAEPRRPELSVHKLRL